jgi:hypothetical protein
MNSKQKLAQKQNEKIINNFFKAHTDPKYYFDLLAYCPSNSRIPASNYGLTDLAEAQQKALESSIMTTGWVIRASVTSIPIYGGTTMDILTLQTIHPDEQNKPAPKVAHEVQIMAQSATCQHGQPLRFEKETGWPVCVDCGSDMDSQALKYELAQESAQAERCY